MTSLGGKLTAPTCHKTKTVNKAEQQTYLCKLVIIALNKMTRSILTFNKTIPSIKDISEKLSMKDLFKTRGAQHT